MKNEVLILRVIFYVNNMKQMTGVFGGYYPNIFWIIRLFKKSAEAKWRGMLTSFKYIRGVKSRFKLIDEKDLILFF